MHPELQQLLEKMLQGEPGSYQNFKSKRRELKGGCSDLEFVTFLSKQADISKLEGEVFFDLSFLIDNLQFTNLRNLGPILAALIKIVATNPAGDEFQKLCAAYLLVRLENRLVVITDVEFEKQTFAKIFAFAKSDVISVPTSIARTCLALMYLYGYGVEKDIEAAAGWIKIAADQKNAQAQYTLGMLLQLSEDEGSDYDDDDDVQAFYWLECAAKQGNANAQFQLGIFYLQERGFKIAEKRAAEMFQLAAEQGHANAQCFFGKMLEDGQGVEKNSAQSLFWTQCSADQGNAAALCELAKRYMEGRSVERDEAKTAELYHEAAETGESFAQYDLGVVYSNGVGVTKDHALALKWFQLAADQGFAEAQFVLGLKYTQGVGVKENHVEALKWFQRAAKNGHVEAMRVSAALHEVGVERVVKSRSHAAAPVATPAAAISDGSDVCYPSPIHAGERKLSDAIARRILTEDVEFTVIYPSPMAP